MRIVKKRRISEDQIDLMFKLYEQGLNTVEISKHIPCSPGYIGKQLGKVYNNVRYDKY